MESTASEKYVDSVDVERLDGSAPGVGAWAAMDSWKSATAFYLAIAILLTFVGLGSPDLIMMEGMVVYAAENMIDGGNLLVPELYGEIYTYKPPLVYWLAALAIKTFGRVEWAVRLPGAMTSLVTGLAVLGLVGRVSRPRTGLLAALAATSGFLWIQKVKVGEFDAVLAALIGIAIAAACYNFAVGRQKAAPWIWLLAYAALTAGLLAKGAPALMAFGPGLLIAAVRTRQARQLLSAGHLAGAALCVGLIALYVAGAWNTAGYAAFDQPLNEAQHRGFTWSLKSFGRTLAKPLIMFAAFLPWSFAWPLSLSGSSATERKSSDEVVERLRQAAWAFLATGVLVFMAVPTHETRYYLPLSVPAAIVCALALERLGALRLGELSKPASRWLRGFGLFFGALLLGMAFAPQFAVSARLFLAILGVAHVAAVLILERRGVRYRAAYVLLSCAICAWAAENAALRPHRARHRALQPVAQTFDAELPRDATVWAMGVADKVGKEASLFYYLERSVRTFQADGPLPPPGAFVVLTARQMRELEEVSPSNAVRLELIRRVDHPRRLFLLYQVAAVAPVAAE